MLGSSAAAFDYNLNIAAIGDPSVPTGVPGGGELLEFVDAVIAGSPDDIEDAQAAIVENLGAASLVDAASVFGNFEMMNRVAEGSGIPISAQATERLKDTIDELGMIGFLKS